MTAIIKDKSKAPKTEVEVSSVKSETHGFNSYMSDMLSPTEDTVLASIGGNYKVYDEIRRDGQVKACFQQRRHAVVSSELIIEAGGDAPIDKAAADALILEVDRLKFNSKCNKMLWDHFYGYATSELVWCIRSTGLYGWKDIKVRDRSRFYYDIDCNLRLFDSAENGSDKDKLCIEPYFWTTSVGATHDDEPYGLGLAHYLYWPVLFKRGGIKFWMKFIERFAQPSIIGTYKKGEKKTETDKLLAAIKSIASETGTIFPEGMDIRLLEATRSGSIDQSKLIDMMNDEISKIILGQTMTTDNGSSQSQANVHWDVRQDIIASDSSMQCESFKDGPATWFTRFNFGEDAKVPLISRKIEKDETPAEKVKTDVEKRKLGFKPTQEYFDATYGEGWVQDSDPVNTDEESNFSDFAEATFPDQLTLDTALDAITANDMNEAMRTIIEPILSFAEKNGPQSTLLKMADVYENMDFDYLGEQLTQMFFASETLGHTSAS